MKESKNNEAPRRKVGRPRKGEGLRVPVTFSVDPEVRDMARALRDAGFPLGGMVATIITTGYGVIFGKSHEETGAVSHIEQVIQDFADAK